MRTRTGILAVVATATSLAVHALLFSAFRVIEIPVAAAPPAPATELAMAVVYLPREPEAAQATRTEREPKPEPEVAPPPEPKPEKAEPEFVIGAADAKGYASHQVPGDREAVAPEAPLDQAYLSLDPVGLSRPTEVPAGSAGDAPADSAPPPPIPAVAVLPPVASVVDLLRPPLPQEDVGPVPESTTKGKGSEPTESAEEAEHAAEPRDAAPAEPDAVPLEPAPPAAAPAPPPPQPPVPVVVVAPGEPPRPMVDVKPAPDTRGRSASTGPGADPAPESDSESDPFSMLGTAEYRDGRLTVRAGRKVKSRRPKIGLAGQVDLYQGRNVSVTLRVAIDATGKVTGVDVVRSSGSNEIDQPCLVAMYDWWFEPKKNAAGVAVPDRFDFTIGFR